MGKKAILHALLFTPMSEGRWGLPIILWGEPGTAKTATIKALAREYRMPCLVLSPGAKGEGAFGVTPCPTQIDWNGKQRTVLDYPPPASVLAFVGPDGEECGILFLDEISTAPPALQPPLLGAIQDRELGGHTFGKRVRVLGAANPVGAQTAGGGYDLPGAVANREGHLDWPGVPFDDWQAWLISGGGSQKEATLDAKLEEAMVMAAWPGEWAVATGQVTAFLRRRPELLHKRPADNDPQLSRAWPSLRTWEYGIRALASARIHKLDQEDTEEIITAFIGAAAAAELFAWLSEQDMPEPAAVLDGTVKWTPDYDRLDRTEAMLAACTALVLPEKAERRDERMEALWAILAEVTKEAKDVVIPSVTLLVKAGGHKSRAAIGVLAQIHLVVTAPERG